ncbi:hypothetical protein V6X63_08375 [Spiribacter sp. 221]|uniref:hypothetical protein n=1 Tax=Spiribacter onubensis TaxID=3122420 RepID=UPI00349FBFA3
MRKTISTAALAVAIFSTPSYGADDQRPEWLFVQGAENAQVIDSEAIVVPMEREIFAFTDRPERRHEHLNAHEFVSGWEEGSNSFRVDPPNVVISWIEDGILKRQELVFMDASVLDRGRAIRYAITGANPGTLPETMRDVSIYVDGSCIPNGMGACGYQADAGPGGLF